MTSPNNLNSARTIEPEKLFAWLESTSLFWQFFARYPDNMSVIALERQGRAVLIVVLAERISTIENGKPPESINELVPKYLDRIPADYADIKIKTP